MEYSPPKCPNWPPTMSWYTEPGEPPPHRPPPHSNGIDRGRWASLVATWARPRPWRTHTKDWAKWALIWSVDRPWSKLSEKVWCSQNGVLMSKLFPIYWTLLLQPEMNLDWIWASTSWAYVWTFMSMFVELLCSLFLFCIELLGACSSFYLFLHFWPTIYMFSCWSLQNKWNTKTSGIR